MKPMLINDRWCIEVYTEEFGNTLLLDDSGLPIERKFDTKDDAKKYIESIKTNEKFK